MRLTPHLHRCLTGLALTLLCLLLLGGASAHGAARHSHRRLVAHRREVTRRERIARRERRRREDRHRTAPPVRAIAPAKAQPGPTGVAATAATSATTSSAAPAPSDPSAPASSPSAATASTPSTDVGSGDASPPPSTSGDASPVPSTGASPTSDASGERVIPIGTAVNQPDLFGSDPRYATTLADNFTGITPEWDMKWDHIEPQEGQWNFGPADQIVNWALAHNMTVHGHCLVWYEELPQWVSNGTWTAATLEAALKTFIQTEVTHFKGRVNEWDVVNEPFNDDGSYRDNIFYQVIGPSYIPLAFEWAHQADPDATLFLNDYNIDWPGPKEQATLALVRQLQAEGIPIGGIGMEEHLSLSWSPSPDQLAQAMSDFASLGLKIEVTEADVDTTGYSGTTAQAQAAQAQVFGELASACRAQPACVRFSVWGVSDAVSWLGAPAAALPFDANYEPTPSWTAIQDGVDNPSNS